jgi:hypothetical protein
MGGFHDLWLEEHAFEIAMSIAFKGYEEMVASSNKETF